MKNKDEESQERLYEVEGRKSFPWVVVRQKRYPVLALAFLAVMLLAAVLTVWLRGLTRPAAQEIDPLEASGEPAVIVQWAPAESGEPGAAAASYEAP